MFKLFTNEIFTEEKENIIDTYRQIKFLGIPISSKYYILSYEKLSDNLVKRKEYFRGNKEYIKFEGNFNDGKPVGKHSYYVGDFLSNDVPLVLDKEEEYDSNSHIRKKTNYANHKKISYYTVSGDLYLYEEHGQKDDLLFRKTLKDGQTIYEDFYTDGEYKHHITSTKSNNSSRFWELCEVRNLHTDELISKTTYHPSSIKNLFFAETQKDGKTTYSLVQRAHSWYDDCYGVLKRCKEYKSRVICAQTSSKEQIYKIFLGMLSLQKTEDKARQSLIIHLRNASTLTEKKNMVLAFRAAEKIR